MTDLTLTQYLILACLIFTLFCWTTGFLGKIKSSCFLLLAFYLLSDIPLRQLLNFPLSGNFITIVFAFLFSQGIVKATFTSRFAHMIFDRFGRKPATLLFVALLLAVVGIFVIPQPFSRAILIAAIMKDYLEHKGVGQAGQDVILFGTFVFATTTAMLVSGGDIILNNAAMGFAGVSLSSREWAAYMLVPSAAVCLLVFFTFILVFSRQLKQITFVQTAPPDSKCTSRSNWSRQEKCTFLIAVCVIVLGMTESLHHIPYYVLLAGATLLMYWNRSLVPEDLKVINVGLLFFLTASFSIGGVLTGTGIAAALFKELIRFFPAEFSIVYILMILVITMVLHMVLGSTITTLSIVIPGLLTITEGVVPPVMVMFLAYISVNIHYLLPFHHVTIMIGAGNQYYSNRTVTRFGIALTVLVILSVLVFYIPWWSYPPI